MKIGIITYWTSTDNYGQLLQCFALQKYLRDQGHDVEVIRHIQLKSSKDFRKLTPKHIYNFCKYKIQKRFEENRYVRYDFTQFRKHIVWSDNIYTGFNSLKEENWDDFDAFICGSDQIWSYKDEDELNTYFLRFAPFQKRKIAYAPSFGTSKLSECYQEKLTELLSQFDAISVRESSGIRIVEDTGKKAVLTVDPTLLLARDIYEKEFNISRSTTNTVFCYFIKWDTDCSEEAILRFCNQNNATPILFSTRGYKSKIKHAELQSPENWLNTLASSKYSIINSFHGLVFSLIFHIPFAVYLLCGEQAAMNSRIFSILELVGLSNRIVKKENTLEEIFSVDIDWKSVDEKLQSAIITSEKFLYGALVSKEVNTTHKNICFLTYGGVHHRYGGLDRVTEILMNQFESDGYTVKYLSFKNRGEFDKSRQIFLPDSTCIKSKCNVDFFNKFLVNNNIDILINQEANVNLCLPRLMDKSVNVISCLHFSPNYISKDHFKKKFESNRLMRCLFEIPFINYIGLNYLYRKLAKNYKQNLRWCNTLVLLSHRFNDSFCRLVKADSNISKLEAINNPLSKDSYSFADGVSKENIILFVGRLDNNFKRIDEMIRDLGSILRNLPNWKFIICGDGPDREKLEFIAKNISTQIEFKGYVDPNQWYQRAKILVLRSSSSEGWGMVITEAMARGVVPVVAGTYASLPDIITDGVDGIISNDTPNDFKNAIKGLMIDPYRLEMMGKAAISKSLRFSVDSIARQWYKLFES